MKKKTLIVIVGPTASGKTSLAIAVARHFGAEILSSDSRQFFKEMRIGTAVPSQEELDAIPHHFIQHKSISESYSVGDFERDATQFITQYFEKNDILVMAGGSGLYEKAVTEGLDEFPEVPGEFRIQLKKELEESGISALQSELEKSDPAYFETADIQNPQRVIRALEIIRSTGQKFSSFLNQKSVHRDFQVIKIGLIADRKLIYDRINRRVDQMVEKGLVEEARSLYPQRELNALQTVGYKELFRYFDGEISLDEAISEIKKNTRRFAKRQLTWYGKDVAVHWFQPGEDEKVIQFLNEKIGH